MLLPSYCDFIMHAYYYRKARSLAIRGLLVFHAPMVCICLDHFFASGCILLHVIPPPAVAQWLQLWFLRVPCSVVANKIKKMYSLNALQCLNCISVSMSFKSATFYIVFKFEHFFCFVHWTVYGLVILYFAGEHFINLQLTVLSRQCRWRDFGRFIRDSCRVGFEWFVKFCQFSNFHQWISLVLNWFCHRIENL